MDSRATRRRRSARRTRAYRASSRAPWPSVVIPAVLVLVVLGALLPASILLPFPKSILVAVATIALLGLIGMVAALGLERSSTVMLVVAFLFAPLTSAGLGIQPLVAASAFFGLAVAFALPRLLHEPLKLPTPFVVGAGLFIGMGLMATPFAMRGVYSVGFLGTAIIAFIVIPALVVWMAPTDRQIFAMALAFGIGCAISTMIGLPRGEFRNRGFTYHPVALAYTTMLALSLVPFLVSARFVRWRWVVVPPIALICLVGTWTAGSRTSILVLGLLGLLVPVLQRSIRLGLTIITAGVLALPFLASYQPEEGSTSALSRLLGEGGAQGSDSQRLYTLQIGLDQIKARPLTGNGYSVEHTYTIHNLYLQVFAAEGIIGLIGMLMMLTVFVGALTRASSPLRRTLAYPAIAVILAGPFQPNMSDHYLGMCLGLALLGATGAVSGRRPGAPEPPPEEPDSEQPAVQAGPVPRLGFASADRRVT